MDQLIEVVTTTETKEQATKLANLLVAAKLAACVQISGPIESIYHWEGELCCSTEFNLSAKSTKRFLSELTGCIEKQHPYDLPQVIIKSCEASGAYTKWVADELRPS